MNKIKMIFGSLIICFVFTNCSNALLDDVKRGADYNYQPGFPELRLEVSEHIGEVNKSYLTVIGDVVMKSLIFKKDGDSIAAKIDLDINIINYDTGKNYRSEFSQKIGTARVNNSGDQLYSFTRTTQVPPGNYEIRVTLTDAATNKSIQQRVEAYLPNPLLDDRNITNINILTKEGQTDFKYVATYDIGIDADSVKLTFQVTNNKADDPVTIQSRLIKFISDTSVASPMSYTNPSASSIIYKGIDYDKFEVIQSSQREFRHPGNVVIEYLFTDLERGNYRFEVAENLDNKEHLYKARDFGVKSANYPALKTSLELARPLVYLMNEDEYNELISLKDDDLIKEGVDRFWLENIQNSVRAKNVISLYYHRVEEANKMFSTYKEGWKTDMGRIYILFGPPIDEYKRLRRIRWTYRFNQLDPEYTYFFEKIKSKTESYPFDNYLLLRHNRYFHADYNQRQLWLSGRIMNEGL